MRHDDPPPIRGNMTRLIYKTHKRRSPQNDTPCVLLIHGLEGFPGTMTILEKRFLRKGWNVLQYTYPCHRVSFYEASEVLERKLSSLPQEQHPDYAVGFSMGGVVLLETLKRSPCIKRNLLLGSPLISSEAAAITLRVPFTRTLLGPSLVELAKPRPLELPATLEFAAIAGRGQFGGSWNPLLSGDNDGLVLVKEALPDAIPERLVVPALHIELVLRKTVFHLIEHYLSTGTLPE